MSEQQRQDTGAGSGAKGGEDGAGAGLWVKGPARHAATIACALLIVGSLAYLIKAVQPPAPFDSTTKLRASGEPIAVFNLPTGGDRVHWVKPGGTASLDRSDPTGARVPVRLEIDGGQHEVYIEEKDFDADDLSRMRALLKRAGY